MKKALLIEEFYQHHQEFKKKVCPHGVENQFYELMNAYKGQGPFIPTLENESLDLASIKKNIPLLKEKEEWLAEVEMNLINIKNFKNIGPLIKKTENTLNNLLQLKEQYFDKTEENNKLEIKNKSLKEMNQLRVYFDQLLLEIPFLQSFHFPFDHLAQRNAYEKIKKLKGKNNREKANQIYFYRKIVEDGASDIYQQNSDLYFRSLLNTVYLKLRLDDEIISENLRYDLKDLFKNLRIWISLGKEKILRRHKAWRDKNQKQQQFYQKIIETKGKLTDADGSVIDVTLALSQSRYHLKNFVIKKQIESYQFWEKLPEIHQALFALESILINEVGSLDGREALERKDILSVVINRKKIKEYYDWSPTDTFYLQYKKENKKEPNSIWQNIMLKEGEFSFTHYFINASLHSFCPDLSPLAKFLRRENLRLALEALESNVSRPTMTRYFSRASMVGRIDMGEIWKDEGYFPESHEVGPPALESHRLFKNYKKGHYNYWYHLDPPQLKVIEIKNRPYVLDLKNKKFHIYRNPQLFRFFQKNRQ